MKLVMAVCVAVVLAFPAGWLGAQEPELTGTPTEIKTYLTDLPQPVTLLAESEVTVCADRVVFTLSVAAEAETMDGALKALRDKKDGVVKSLKARGIAPEKILTLSLPTVPLHRPATADQPERFKAANYVRVLVENEKDFESAAAFINTANDVTYEGVAYELVNEAAQKVKALQAACADIDLRKKAYEAQFGVVLVLKGLRDDCSVTSGEKIKVDGSVAGLKMNLEMGQFVVKVKVQATYLIRSAS